MQGTIQGPTDTPSLDPGAIAARLNLKKTDVVLAWIARGELKATNIASDPTTRPLWRITEADLAAFLESRRATPKAKRQRKGRPKQAV